MNKLEEALKNATNWKKLTAEDINQRRSYFYGEQACALGWLSRFCGLSSREYNEDTGLYSELAGPILGFWAESNRYLETKFNIQNEGFYNTVISWNDWADDPQVIADALNNLGRKLGHLKE